MSNWTFFDQVMGLIAAVGTIGAIFTYFYTHPRKKQK